MAKPDHAQSLINIARRLYINDAFDIDLENTAYALDATTIDPCLNVFPWAHFRKTKAAVKLHTQMDLRGNIPTFIQITNGTVHDVTILDTPVTEPGSFYIMDRCFGLCIDRNCQKTVETGRQSLQNFTSIKRYGF